MRNIYRNINPKVSGVKSRFHVIIFISLLFAVIFCLSCDSSRIYEKNVPVNNGSWSRYEPLVFKVNIEDTISANNFYINLRYSADYRFSNIFLFIDTYFPDGNYTRDTIEYILAGADGKWFGKGLGKIKENRILLKQNVIFPQKGVYEFRFEQAMRMENLEGIEDVGIRIEKTQE